MKFVMIDRKNPAFAEAPEVSAAVRLDRECLKGSNL
jgi:hypothetical protein